MRKIVNMHEAKSNLSKLVEEAISGDEIVVARAGTPTVRLVPIRSIRRRRLGQWKGKVYMSRDFDSLLSDEEIALWEGGESRQ